MNTTTGSRLTGTTVCGSLRTTTSSPKTAFGLYGHKNDYQSYLLALQRADAFVGDLLRTLDTMGEYGATTTVVVTTDHGRSAKFTGHGGDHPESGRVWMMAVGGAVPARGVVTAGREYHLADIAGTLLALAGLTPHGGSGATIAEMLPDTEPSDLVEASPRVAGTLPWGTDHNHGPHVPRR